MSEVYKPMVTNLNKGDWGTSEKESVEDFLQLTKKCEVELNEAIKSMESDSEKFTLSQENVSK